MSVEEEVELRDLVVQTLDTNGCLPKIRAQLRANLFLALDEDSKISKQQPLINNKIKSHLEFPEGHIMFCLVREFLEYFDLDFTISVYEPESYVGNCYKYEGRQKIIEDLGLKPSDEDLSGPVLLELIKLAQIKAKTLKINLTNLNGEKDNDLKETDSSSPSSAQNDVNGYEASENSVDLKKSECIESIPEKTKDHVNSTNVDNDDTFNGTSSIEEETANGTHEGLDSKQNLTAPEEEGNKTFVYPQNQESSSDSKSKSEDRAKAAQKSDKIKSKMELSPLNKSRRGEILPSLYNKDFKDKNKDVDFDIKDDYEEDFMSGSEVEFSVNKVEGAKPLLEELNEIENKNLSLYNKNQKNDKHSDSEKKTVNSSTETEDIKTNLSIDTSVSQNSSAATSL